MRWIEFLNDNMIEFASSGPRTTRGHVEVHCPLCGPSDETMHLGINLSNDHWYCWRNKEHRGTKPDYLISRLLAISGPQARLLMQAYQGAPDDFNAPAAVKNALQPILPVTWPDEFAPLTDRYFEYLENRGFDKPNNVASYYNLECCHVGRWKQRLIIPVLDHDMNILGWQGRAIVSPKKAPRYLTSHQQVKRNIFNLQNIESGLILFVCEGSFDALKIDWYGKPKYRATCIFGSVPIPDQILQIKNLMPAFRKTIVLFDADYAGISGGFNLHDWLPNVQLSTLPDNCKDPGSMSKNEVRRYLNDFTV